MEKNITGEKMLSHIDRIAGEKKPITADIFLTNYCNNRCPYCTYGRWELDTGAQAMRYGSYGRTGIYTDRWRRADHQS